MGQPNHAARLSGAGTSGPLVTQVNSFGTIRNNFSGWVGFQFLVGPNPLTVTELGRWVLNNNSGNHVVKLFDSNGTPVPNGSVTVSTAGKPAGQFAYATLSMPVVLAAGTYYEVMSQETSGGDTWYDYSGTAITLSGDANSAWAMWAYNDPPPYYGAVGGSGKSYGPVNLRYSTDQEEGDFILAGETRYIYDGMRVIQERNENNTPTVSYTRGLDLSGTREGAGGIGGLLARSDGYSSGTWTTHYYYHADGGGNITYMINGSEGMAAQYRYDPFGWTLYTDGPLAEANVYRFSSKEFLENAGFYYYGFRFYDPGTQRWVNRDPTEELGGVNLYAYVSNQPVDNVDPLGLDYYVIYVTAFSGFPHQVVVGDNGMGGSYVLDYGPASGGINRIYGPGKYNYIPYSFPPNQTAYNLSSARCVKTTPAVSQALNNFAALLGANINTPNYCFLWNNCWSTAPRLGNIANNYMNFGTPYQPINIHINLPPLIITQ
ncbi:MAG: RHS repeat-associated core domain-containing protein [Candidatus Omnitrophica bacterium]|nr:RHS repeat-associated core domain-containing protein [Candidatus Omnitrophota bacterium]